MTNYQLYRSNVLLGGQMKYDLILSSYEGDSTIIEDLHITPISKVAAHNKYVKENLILYDHQENIMGFYKKNSSFFYKDFCKATLQSPYPLPDNYQDDPYDSTYEMGCRRSHYQIYNKQFEFFCPLWIEQLDDIKKLTFDIQIKTTHPGPIMYTRTVKFDSNQQLVNYFNNYLKYTSLNEGCDWVFNVGENNCSVRGLNVKTGRCGDYELLTLYRNLIFRERPLLEFNNLIINTLNEKELIACQLFNFNLCFNLEDIFGAFVYRELCNSPIFINVVAKIDGKPLTLADIFSNHECIEKQLLQIPEISINSTGDEIKITKERLAFNKNVLDYLKDYSCLDLIDKNKIIQNTCHWSLSIAPERIFNTYGGFSMMKKNDGGNDYVEIPGYDTDVADLVSVDITRNINKTNNYWCNNYKILLPDSSDTDSTKTASTLGSIFFEPIFSGDQKYDYLFSRFYNGCFVKSKFYNNLSVDGFVDTIILFVDGYEKINPVIKDLIINYEGWYTYTKIKSTESEQKETAYEIIYSNNTSGINKVLILVPIDSQNPQDIQDAYNCVLYRNFIDILQNLKSNGNKQLNNLYNLLSKPTHSMNIVEFNNGLILNQVAGPSLDVKEIEYYKSTIKKNIFRIFGKIKPYFLHHNLDNNYENYQYYKMKFGDLPSEYNIHANADHPPLYPSINYYAMKSGPIDYNCELEDGFENKVENSVEMHHYAVNKIVNLLPELNFEFELNKNDSKSIEEKVIDFIKNKYSTILESSDNGEEKYNAKLKYIYDKYKLSKIYISENQTTYNIQIKLK